jgi:hypothetical protein
MTKAEIVPTNFEMDYYAIWELLMTVISLVPLTTKLRRRHVGINSFR